MLVFFDALFKTVLTPTTESTLSITRSALQLAVADFANVAKNYALPTDTADLARVNRAIDSGLRNVYWPALVLGEASAHEWSWMRPVRTFTTSADYWSYQLWADLGGIEGELTFAAGQSYRVIHIRGENYVRQLQQTNAGSGIPRYAAVRGYDSGLSGQRYELILWPTPDAAYDLTARININPDALASDNDYALGGPALAETILQSCRAAADRIFNDNVGAEHALFIERLKSSISLDRRMLAPERLGFAYDPAVVREQFYPWPESYALPGFTVNGVTVQ
jgi:hypothetical protein